MLAQTPFTKTIINDNKKKGINLYYVYFFANPIYGLGMIGEFQNQATTLCCSTSDFAIVCLAEIRLLFPHIPMNGVQLELSTSRELCSNRHFSSAMGTHFHNNKSAPSKHNIETDLRVTMTLMSFYSTLIC